MLRQRGQGHYPSGGYVTTNGRGARICLGSSASDLGSKISQWHGVFAQEMRGHFAWQMSLVAAPYCPERSITSRAQTMNDYSHLQGAIGVYAIWCGQSTVYVGESTDIASRIAIHIDQLQKGTHHNFGLQACWNEHKGLGFRVELVHKAPSTKIDLHLVRWLAEKEEEAINRFRSLGLQVTNRAPSEVVPSVEALKEYKHEETDNNKRITEARRDIKQQIEYLKWYIERMLIPIRELQERERQLTHCVNANTGWVRSIFGLDPNSKGQQALKELQQVQERLREEMKLLDDVQSQAHSLELRSKQLYQQYYGVEKRNRHRFRMFRGQRPLPWDSPPVTRRKRKIVGLEESQCRVTGNFGSQSAQVVLRVLLCHDSKTTIPARVDKLPYEIDCQEVVAAEVITGEEPMDLEIAHGSNKILQLIRIAKGARLRLEFEQAKCKRAVPF